ncbi:MAG: hypothetical protein M3548_23035 [Actinomycetota bacterium]|nr:hypothetical protein [Actinomycetota bacterium]
MRRAQALTVVGAAVLLVAGCSNRPNDLYSYYDAPAPPTVPVSTAPVVGATSSPTATSSAPARSDQAVAAAMTEKDLKAEGVIAQGAPVPEVLAVLPDCGAELGTATAGVRTTWRYASGSMLRQYVAGYPDDAAVTVGTVREALTCGTFRVEGTPYRIDEGVDVTALSDVDAKDSWCATAQRLSICTLILAKGPVVTVVSVEAGTAARARAAVARIAPIAVNSLARDQDTA